MYYFHITKVSKNKKTGPIAVTTSGKNTCPSSCSFKGNGCYAESGPLNIHWNKVTQGDKRSITASQLMDAIRAIPSGSIWRHNQGGDLMPSPNNAEHIDSDFLKDLTRANKVGRKKGFTYTHYSLNTHNIMRIKRANLSGFTVNVSADNASQAARIFKDHRLPTVTVLPMGAPNIQVVDSVRVIACPAEKSPKVNCATCKLCADSKRDYVIGFRAHGISKKKADIIAKG